MQVAVVNSIYQNRTRGLTVKNPLNNASSAGSFASSFSNYSSENVKANFLPSFGIARKVGKAEIIDRETGEPILADVKRDTVGSYVTFNLNLGRKSLGFLTMNCDSIYPVAEHVITLPTDNIPKVVNLRTIEGEKYSGIGTALIKTAIQESYNNKSYGNLWLNAEKGYERNLSPYRSNENPIPFYYKMGFRSPDEELDKFIKKCIQDNKIRRLPDTATLLLTTEAKNKWLKEISLSPIMKLKKIPLAG